MIKLNNSFKKEMNKKHRFEKKFIHGFRIKIFCFFLEDVDGLLDVIKDSQSKVYDELQNYEQNLTQDYEKLSKLLNILKIYETKVEKNLEKCSDIHKKIKHLLKEIDSRLNPDEKNCNQWTKEEVTRFVQVTQN